MWEDSLVPGAEGGGGGGEVVLEDSLVPGAEGGGGGVGELPPSSAPSQVKGNKNLSCNRGKNLVESVMFIAYTHGDKLKSELTKLEQNQPYDRKIKFVEKMGLTLNNILCKKDPVSDHCGRECFLCESKPGGGMHETRYCL